MHHPRCSSLSLPVQLLCTVASLVLLCASARAQSGDPALIGSWHDNAVPELLWVSRGAQDCARIKGQGGVWVARRIMDVQTKQAREISCNHVWRPDEKLPPDIKALRAALPGAEPDFIVVSGMGDAEHDELWSEPWYELARSRYQIPVQHPDQGQRKLVRVAVLDSAAAGGAKAGYTDPSAHGRAVARVVEQLACGELHACATEVLPYAALPLLSSQDQTIRSAPLDAGAVGSRGLLAAKIEQATQDWLKARDTADGARHLIINLSLGWSGCWEPARKDGSPGSLASELVRRAIERASCNGALVIAAGGNGDVISGCPAAALGEPRHMFPGLWGGQPISAKTCAAVGVRNPAPEASRLLLGIGAVDREDRRLSTSDHEANLVAYGQNVIMPDASSESGWTLALAGTSMSAAAVSGTAAGIWAYASDLSPDKLVDLLRESAEKLRDAPSDRDFICNDPAGCKQVRRVSFCAALRKARPDLRCDPADLAARTSVPRPMAVTASEVTLVECSLCPADCPSECALPADAGERDSQDVPWVVPQPKPPACGTCTLVPNYFRFQAQFNKSIRDARLVVQSSSRGRLVYKLGDADTDPLDWYLPLDVGDAYSASLVYRLPGSVLSWESGDIPLSDGLVFADEGGLW